VNLYSYRLDEVKRSWLEFKLKPKGQLIEFLKQRGYEVVENAVAKGRSGADHKIDILATRDDGIIGYTIAIGVKVAVDKIELSEIFDFDDKGPMTLALWIRSLLPFQDLLEKRDSSPRDRKSEYSRRRICSRFGSALYLAAEATFPGVKNSMSKCFLVISSAPLLAFLATDILCSSRSTG